MKTTARFRILLAPALLASALAGCSDVESGPTSLLPGWQSEVYEDDAHWLCRRGLADDVCDHDLDTTFLEADGTARAVQVDPKRAHEVDCFYVYPTVRLGTEGNAAFDGRYEQEISTTRFQAAPFAESCDVFAPLYRQRTLSAPPGTGIDYGAIAYADVLDAFRTYLSRWNGGRPFVLIGHSQGAGLLRQLVSREIDPDPVLRSHLVSALLLGATVEVPVGGDVGGSFAEIPACREPGQFGCVVSYASFRESSPPPEGTFFARAQSPGMEALCTNPASLAGGAGDLTPRFSRTEATQFSPVNPNLGWAPDAVGHPQLSTPFVAMPGLVTAECRRDRGYSWLSLRNNPDPGPRQDDIGGDLSADWGMHLVDVNVASVDLVRLVASQSEAWLRARR
ncbi:MAG: DUF3089 domain-containing protein [Alphaproteobacteria bacterium]